MHGSIRISGIKNGHVQGIAVDEKNGHMYFSFTTCLIKTDMDGNVIGSVQGLCGHLGCIAFCPKDNRIYGSLEYKHDSIGAGIMQRLGESRDIADGFYVAIFDVAKINGRDMDAELDGVMTAVHLAEVLEDFSAEGHRYGCSGIDGITFAPAPGDTSGKKDLYVAYGIYGDVSRDDNDYQVILRYGTEDWKEYERPLNQDNMHRCGPKKPSGKYFVYTGNTTYGVQNLEYDQYSGYMLAAVYRGRKESFPNFPMFAIDLNASASYKELKNTSECADQLALAKTGVHDEKTDIYGIEHPYGATGMISLGNGLFYFSEDFKENGTWGTEVKLYRFCKESGRFTPWDKE